MSAQVIITVDQTGQSTVKANGVTGSACKDLTRPFEEALGKKVADVATPEMYRPQPQQQGIRG